MSSVFAKYRQEADGIGEHNDCAVIAVALLAGKPYSEVHAMFAKAGRKFGHRTKRTTTLAVLKRLKIKLVDVTRHYNAKTVKSLAKEVTSRANLLVTVRGHILCIRDGEVHDWTKNRGHHIQQILQVQN